MYVYDEANNLAKQKGVSLITLVIVILIIIFVTVLVGIYFIDRQNENKDDVKIVEISNEIDVEKEKNIFTNRIENSNPINSKIEIQTKYKTIYTESSDIYDNENYIIYDITEYNEFLSKFTEIEKNNKDLDQYDEKYFQDNALAIISVTIPNPLYNIKVKDMEINDNELFVNYYLERSEGTTMAVVCGEIMLVEVNKNVNKINVKEVEV